MTRPNWFTLLKTTVCLFIAGTLDGLHDQAVPRRVIVLRHAEKSNSHVLSGIKPVTSC